MQIAYLGTVHRQWGDGGGLISDTPVPIRDSGEFFCGGCGCGGE